MEFFKKSTTNLMAAAKSPGVGHYVAVSIVDGDELPRSGYKRAKVPGEARRRRCDSYSIVRAKQFAELTEAITASLTVGDEVCVPDALIPQVATEGLVDEVARVARRHTTGPYRDHRRPDNITCSRGLGPAKRSQARSRRPPCCSFRDAATDE
jgi:uncharacterized protein YbjT (DUF2867 family)